MPSLARITSERKRSRKVWVINSRFPVRKGVKRSVGRSSVSVGTDNAKHCRAFAGVTNFEYDLAWGEAASVGNAFAGLEHDRYPARPHDRLALDGEKKLGIALHMPAEDPPSAASISKSTALLGATRIHYLRQ